MNFVPCNEDRFTKKSMSWSGSRDHEEQVDWERKMEAPHGLRELSNQWRLMILRSLSITSPRSSTDSLGVPA